MTIKIPDGYKVIGFYGRGSSYVYLKPKDKKKDDGAAIPFCLIDEGFNINLPSQLGLNV